MEKKISAEEWQTRLELAACYRIVDFFGWSEAINNHITARIPGGKHEFLINSFGLNYSEITARNLVKLNLDGEKLDKSPGFINRAGYIIHSAIHQSRPDIRFIIHTHTTAGMAVACKQGGLSFNNFYGATFYDRVAYHPFEGISTMEDERPRLAKNLGDKSILILKNHGLLVCGKTAQQMIATAWTLQRACEIQAMADAMEGKNEIVSQAVLQSNPARSKALLKGEAEYERLFFDAVMRKMNLTLNALAK